jgi:hypothetical protein
MSDKSKDQLDSSGKERKLNSAATILPTGQVKNLLTAEEQNLVALIANILVDQTLNAYEERNTIPEVQQ